MYKTTHMKLTSLLLVIFFLCASSGAQSIDLGGLLNQVIQEANKTAGQPAPARQSQNNTVPSQQGNATVGDRRDRQPNSTVISNQPQQPPPKDNASNLSYEPQPSEIKVVEVEGVGENQQKAKEDAYRNAVEKAVGSFVSADLVAKNDQLIKDEVLNFSAGYIEKSEVISEGKRPDGLYSIKLRASVAKKKLTRQLEKLNIATADVDSESIFAEAITTSNQRDSAQKIWAKLFDDFWSKAFEVEVSGKPQLAYGPDDNVQAYFKVVVRFNQQFLQELENTIKGTGSSLRNEFVRKIPHGQRKQGFSTVCLVRSTTYNQHGRSIGDRDDRLNFSYLDHIDEAHPPHKSAWPFDQSGSIRLEENTKSGDVLCGEVPIDLSAWQLPHSSRVNIDRTFSPFLTSLRERGIDYLSLGFFKQLELPHVLLTANNKAHEIVASAAGILVGSKDYPDRGLDRFVDLDLSHDRSGEIIGGGAITFMGHRVDERYISVQLKRGQLQDISKVEVRAVGKLIYVDPANLEGKGKSREGLGNSDRSDRKYR